MAGNTQFLLDTIVLLAARNALDTVPTEVQAELCDLAYSTLSSAASIWEIAIERFLGRVAFNFRLEDFQQLALDTGFIKFAIMSEHCHRVADLPWHHLDPFDRLLVSQAQSIPAYLLTTDELLARYSDLVRLVVPK